MPHDTFLASDDRVVWQFSQENQMVLLFADMAIVVQSVESFIEGLFAMGTIITLATVRSFSMLMLG